MKTMNHLAYAAVVVAALASAVLQTGHAAIPEEAAASSMADWVLAPDDCSGPGAAAQH